MTYVPTTSGVFGRVCWLVVRERDCPALPRASIRKAEQKTSAWCYGGISGLVVEYIVAIDVTRVRFPADASNGYLQHFWFPKYFVLHFLCT